MDGELAITSDWDGGFCGSLMTRNPASIPSTTWAGLFTFSGGTLTTGPNGNGVSKKITDTQWTFVPDDPAQVRDTPGACTLATGGTQLRCGNRPYAAAMASLLACTCIPAVCCTRNTVPAPAGMQMAIYPQSTVMATFCCDAENKADVQASFRVIYSFDTPGVGATDPLLPR